MTDTLQPPAAEQAEVPTISGVEQRRVLHTPIPGPRSQELHARKTSAVAAGVGVTLPGTRPRTHILTPLPLGLISV